MEVYPRLVKVSRVVKNIPPVLELSRVVYLVLPVRLYPVGKESPFSSLVEKQELVVRVDDRLTEPY